MANEILQYQQGSEVAAVPEGFEQVTNPLGPPKRTSSRFAHFPSDVYDLSAETHLARFMKVLLGDAGTGQLHKRYLLARLQQTIGGINFFDLDAFYGAVLGVRRRASELLAKNPTQESLTPDEWDQVRIRDGAYRSRIEQFAKALNLGATKRGIEATAEALLGCQCDVIESWSMDDRVTQTWGGVQAAYATWGAMEGRTWGDLEVGTVRPFQQRHIIRVYPHRELTIEERYSVQFSLDRLKPAGSLVIVERAIVDSYIPVSVAGIYADSTHWEVRSSVRNTLVNGTELLFDGEEDEIVPVSPPPWGAYQGEAWTLMSSNPVVVAYSTPTDVSVTDQVDPAASDVVPQRVRVDDQEISFGPTNAVRPVQATMAGRSVSDGVLSCNPHTGWNHRRPPASVRGSRMRMVDFDAFDPTLPADVYVDGIHIDKLKRVIGRDRAGRSAPLFWTSAVRPYSATDNEVVEVRMEEENEVNHVSYEIASFPQQVDVQAWVTDLGQWVSLHSQTYRSSNPAGITGAIPRGYLHPYHHGSDHWVKINVGVASTLTNRVRFVLKRISDGSPPTGFDGTAVPYPLGLRHVDIGYRVSSLSALPNTDMSQPVSTTSNVLGQPVQNSVTVFKASNAADGSESYWKCEAQPISQAVVNLYLDISDSYGNDQVFDRIFVDPYTSGPTMNLYWANSTPTDIAYAESLEEPILPINATGNITALESGDRGLKWSPSTPAWLDFDNNEMNFDPTVDWWWACEFYPGFTVTTVPDRACLFSIGTEQDATDYGDISLVFNSSGNTFTFRFYGLSITTSAWDWTPGQKLKLAGKWIAAEERIELLIANPNGDKIDVVGMSGTYTPPTSNPGVIRIGRSLGSSVSNDVALNSTLLQFVMGFGDHDLGIVCSDSTLETYTTKPRYADSEVVDRTAGTFLRYHPSYTNWYSPGGYSMGFMGGHVNMWSLVEWTPIAQDYTLARGYLRFATVRAKYLKLEFTNLAPEPFETFLSHSKSVKVFSSTNTVLPSLTGRAIEGDPQPVYSTDQIVSDRFVSSMPNLQPGFERRIGQTDVDDQYRLKPSPTTGLVVSDPVSAARLSTHAGYGFDMLQWQPSRISRQFTQKGKHVYDTVVLEHTNKIAFFAGVREIVIGRSDQKIPLDTEVYVDPFYDLENISSYTSNYDPGLFYTDPSGAPAPLITPEVVTSQTFMSLTPVTDLQFATQQTPAQQIMPDDRFKDTGLSTSTFDSLSEWHSYGDARVIWDVTRQGLLVSRNPSSVITFIDKDTPLIHPPITPVFTTSPTTTATLSSSSTGGIESPDVVPSKGGMLHVAVRLTPMSTLQTPITMQLIGSDGTTVLAEKEVTSQAGVQVEAVLPYILNSQPLLEGTVRIRLVQQGPYRDEWVVNTFSLFDDGILWEFSNDGGLEWTPAWRVRNNYAGLVNFPKASNALRWRCTMYRQSVGIDMLDMRPWYQGKVV